MQRNLSPELRQSTSFNFHSRTFEGYVY